MFFVSGGAGFIGGSLCEALIGNGAEVVAYDNMGGGVSAAVRRLSKEGRLSLVKGDLLDFKKVNATFRKHRPDVVVHLAANADVRKGGKDTKLDLMQGLMLTYNVLEASRISGASHIIFPSSSTVYGEADVKPTPETYGPLKPISLYGASKLASEGYITAFSRLYGFRYSIFRLANIVGKGMTHGIIPDLVGKLRSDPRELQVLGDGRQRKSYVDVSDCVGAMLHVVSKTEGSDIYNISTDDQISAAEIARCVVDIVAKGARIRFGKSSGGWPGDIPDSFLSNKKLKAAGYRMECRSSREVVRKAVAECAGSQSKAILTRR